MTDTEWHDARGENAGHKSAKEWLADPEFRGITIIDPDGWDRHPDRWQARWNEKISRVEFLRRMGESTVLTLPSARPLLR